MSARALVGKWRKQRLAHLMPTKYEDVMLEVVLERKDPSQLRERSF